MVGANIPFKKNQLIQVENTTNAKALTSVARIAGLSSVVGFGDEPNCGVIPGLT